MRPLYLYGNEELVWITLEPEILPAGVPERLRIEQVPELLPLAQDQGIESESICDTCIVIDRLVLEAPRIQKTSVNILLGTMEHISRKAECSCCCSLSTAAQNQSTRVSSDAHLAFYFEAKRFNFRVISSESIFEVQSEFIRHPETRFWLLSVEPMFEKGKYGRILAPNDIDLSIIKGWIQNCDEHNSCKGHGVHSLLPPLPKILLIDVQENRLVQTSINVRYLALSYVWGQVETYKTTTQNIDDLLCTGGLVQDHVWKHIPQTIKDAIYLTKQLGIQYLWVDSLCIIQDELEKSKKSLLRAMPTVYASAYFTIVAADGNNANHGLRGISNPRNLSQIIVDLLHTTLRDLPMRNADPVGSPWANRGWTLQESLFSPRMLVFNGALTWICNFIWYFEEVVTFSDPPNPDDSVTSSSIRSYFLKQISSHTLVSLSRRVPNLEAWREMVTLYRRRDLTFEADALNAFEGIQTVLSPGFRNGFFYGLPEMFFDLALLWQTKRQHPELFLEGQVIRNNKRNHWFPSWSWAGWTGELNSMFWEFLFNHVYASSHGHRYSSCTQTIPLVKWRKKETMTNILKPIDNSYYAYQENMGKGDELPEEWTFNATNKSYTYGGSTDNEWEQFHFPFPIKEPSDQKIASTRTNTIYDPFLHFTAQKGIIPLTRFTAETRVGAASTARIYNDKNIWIGDICMNVDAPEIRNEIHEDSDMSYTFLAISCAKEIYTPPKPLIAPDDTSNIVNDEDDQEKEEREIRVRELYNILCVEWDEGTGIAYRKGLGRILKEAWGQFAVGEVNVVLG